MKYFTEFIIYHDDMSMPKEEKFCPLLWKAEDFDSDGDFYYDNIEGRWTQLELESKEDNDLNSILNVYVYREFNRNYEPSISDISDLKRFIDYKKRGDFDHNISISKIKKPAIASFRFETFSIDHYRDFLSTIHFFLKYSGGCIVNHSHLPNADEFVEEFLKNNDSAS